MILKCKVNGIPNGKHKRFIRPAPGNKKAIEYQETITMEGRPPVIVTKKRTEYELFVGEDYDVNFPEKESYWELDEKGKRVRREKTYTAPGWFDYKKETKADNKHPLLSAKG